MKQTTRRNFLAVSAMGAGLAGLAACSSSTTTDEEASDTSTAETSADDPLVAPDASAYPIEPDGEDVEALWTSELAGEERTGNGWTRVTNPGGTTLGVMDATKIIQVDGLAFKDLDGDGKLSLWEDWRQSADDRAAALAETFTYEDVAPLMANFSIPNKTEDFDEEFSSDFANCPTSTTGTIEQGVRTILSGTGDDYKTTARWMNLIQEACEADNGIPMLFCSDPVSFGLPEQLARAATFDPSYSTRANKLRAKAYRSIGVVCELGPQMDICDPRWCRIAATYGEDPALSRDMARASVDALQSTFDDSDEDQGWGTDSVMCEIKHFPGDGCCEGGRESHQFMGKYRVYPGNNFPAHLIAFFDGAMNLDGKTGGAGAAMPTYSAAFGEESHTGSPVAAAFDDYEVGLLRNNGFDGVVCTDWGALETEGEAFQAAPWGVEDISRPERIAMMIKAGTDQVGGGADLENTLAAYDVLKEELGADEADALFKESGRRIMKASFLTGIFDNPYVDTELIADATSNSEIDELAEEIGLASVVMVKNKGGVVCERADKPTVYIPMEYSSGSAGGMMGGPGGGMMGGSSSPSFSLAVDEETANAYFNVVTDTVLDPTGDADEDGNATYAETDVQRASADQIAACDFAFVMVSAPSAGSYGGGYDSTNECYIPISRQYRPYTADGANVRQTSISGDPADGTSWVHYDSTDGVEIENRSYYGGTSSNVTNESDLDLILSTVELAGDVPVVVGITASSPMCFHEFEDQVDAILIDYDSSVDACLMAIAAGQAEPNGLLPMQQPLDMDAVEKQLEDVPRDMDCYVDSEGNEYDFGFGLDWSGVIDDDRTAKYCVDPLTTPETISV